MRNSYRRGYWSFLDFSFNDDAVADIDFDGNLFGE